MREDIAPEIEVDKVRLKEPTREDMPDWWDPNRPPERLAKGTIYRGKDGRWHDLSGRVYNREERRRAGVR